ncbi:YibE/F family protein [Modestobacter sp. NPDC049651]|uniref:YibE/F family protein n=1 Tax=unclassified Modestobacter TaxID=2643866 RepID=UPI003409B0A4
MSAHSHAPDDAPPDPAAAARRRSAVRFMLWLLVPVGVATLAGLMLLWPSGEQSAAGRAAGQFLPPGTTFPQATVVQLTEQDCTGDATTGPPQTCATAVVVVADGASAGDNVQVDLSPDVVASGVQVGDELVLSRQVDAASGQPTYAFQDFPRGTPIVVLAIVFAVLVGAVARLRGLMSLLGLGFAFVVLLEFVLPGLLAGESPVWVSLVGSSAIMFVVLYLAHGFSARTTTALVGTLFGLAISAALGAVAVSVAHLTGFSSEATIQLQTYDPTLDFSGLVLAATVVAGLGILNDVTITQASAVWQLHEAAPQTGWRELFRRGMAIGRDHIASTVYTLVFAYAGAALPLLLLFEIYQRPFWTVLTGQEVGEEVIRTLVGGIALVLAVPVTTVIGALVATAATATTTPPAPEPTPEEVAAEREAERRRERLRAMREAAGGGPATQARPAADGRDLPRPR